MARLDDWEKRMRAEVADAGYADGWSLIQRNRKVQVQHSWLEPGGTRKKATAMLNIEWKRGCTKSVMDALEFISGSMQKGNNLKAAVKLLGGKEDSAGGLDWDGAWQRFRAAKIGSGVEDERRFDRNDGSRWKYIRMGIFESPPQNASEVFTVAIRKAETNADGTRSDMEPGSPGRRRRVQTTNQFLSFCRDELGFEERWNPPANYTKWIGVAAAVEDSSNKKDAVPEWAIKPLMGSFRDTPSGRQWRMAVGLLACFGLRPWELHYLRIDGEHLRVTRGKKNLKQAKGRLVVGIDPQGMPGLSKQLLVQLASGEPGMPAIGKHHDMTGCRTNRYLSSIPFWAELKASAKDKGEVLASYSFRHRYAYAADEAGFNDRMTSKLMGHSRETFVKFYGDKARDEELLAAAERLLNNQQVPAFV